MFLSKKIIITIISVTGVLFTILLVIQFVWIKKSVEVNQQQFADKMNIVRDRIYKTLKNNEVFIYSAVPEHAPVDFYKGDTSIRNIEKAVKDMMEEILHAQDIYLPCRIVGRVGARCYIHGFDKGMSHNVYLDKSDYKFCLCKDNRPLRVDIGLSFPDLNKHIVHDTSWLIFPSFILIVLLLALFIFIIVIINKQKGLAELKNDFINNLTHEFNTPLFSIGLTSKLLLRSDEINKSEKLKKYIELITVEKNRLQTQVDKMLQLSAIESGSLLLEKRPVDMHKVIERNISGFSAAIEEKKGKLTYQPQAVEHFVLGDEVHLFNVISSLLENAYKYTDKRPEIKVTTHNTGKEIVITIQDNGIGISDQAMKMIFDKFYREKNGNRHDVKGFGIGLSYVKKIVEMHEGAIQVNSRKAEGTIFIINLPVINN